VLGRLYESQRWEATGKIGQKVCDSVGEESTDSVGEKVEKRMRGMMKSILSNRSHSLHDTVVAQQSSHSDQLLSISCRTERFRRSFVPAAIRLYNGSA